MDIKKYELLLLSDWSCVLVFFHKLSILAKLFGAVLRLLGVIETRFWLRQLGHIQSRAKSLSLTLFLSLLLTWTLLNRSWLS